MPVSGQGSGHFIRSPVLGRLRLAVEAQADTGGYRRIRGECAAPVTASRGLGLTAGGGRAGCPETRVRALPRLGPAPGDFAS